MAEQVGCAAVLPEAQTAPWHSSIVTLICTACGLLLLREGSSCTYVEQVAMVSPVLAGHAIHHSSPDFNFSVGARSGIFDIFFVSRWALISIPTGEALQRHEWSHSRHAGPCIHHMLVACCTRHVPTNMCTCLQFHWMWYLPLALVCPPSIYLFHRTTQLTFTVGAAAN